MLNLGLIGDIQLLEPYARKAMEHPGVVITGKSSVGTQPQPASFRLHAPEFNRIELIERSDALLINKFSLMPFQLVCDMIKKTRHIFAISYPDLSFEECSLLAKLAGEAKTVIQIVNPLYYKPPIMWLNKNVKKPSFTSVSHFYKNIPETDFLLTLLLMLQNAIGTGAKKTNAVSFRSMNTGNDFMNIHLELNDGSVIQFNTGKTVDTEEFIIKSYASNHFAVMDVTQNLLSLNNQDIDLTGYEEQNEINDFINTILQNKKAVTSIEKFATALQTKHTILDKLNRYINC
jgi:hypothetical protein